MVKLDKKAIAKLTKLSRIACTSEEEDAILQDLQQILVYFEQLEKINTENVPPCNHVLADIVNVTRDDIVGPTLSREAFLNNAPSHIGGMIRVPPVLKNS